MSYKGQIKGFPEAVVQKMLQRQVQQGNTENVKIFEERNDAAQYGGAFNWEKSPEGHIFWTYVINFKWFHIFFQKYPEGAREFYQKTYISNPLPCIGIHELTFQFYESLGFKRGHNEFRNGYTYAKISNGDIHHGTYKGSNSTINITDEFNHWCETRSNKPLQTKTENHEVHQQTPTNGDRARGKAIKAQCRPSEIASASRLAGNPIQIGRRRARIGSTKIVATAIAI